MPIMTTGEAAAKAGVGVETVRGWIRKGHLSARLFGRVYVIDSADLDRLLADPPKSGRPRKEERG